MTETIGIRQFIQAIESLPSDPPHHDSRVWYTTQKEHWLGWLGEYLAPGAYGRSGVRDDARFAYNHAVNYQMLVWLIKASGVDAALVQAAEEAAAAKTSLGAKSGAI